MSASRKPRSLRLPIAAALGLSFILADLPLLPGFVSPAEARIGRPWTPLSYAGVARRTTRRAIIARSAIYVAALPPACVRVTVNGTRVWRCSGIYYQAYKGRYVVVYVK